MTTIEAYSPETEATVLACMMNSEEQFAAAKASLTPDDFYTSGNRKIFRIMLEAHERNGRLDLPSLLAYWKDTQDLPADKYSHLVNLNDMSDRYQNTELHCETLKDFTIRREISDVIKESVHDLDKGDTGSTILHRLLDKANDLHERHKKEMDFASQFIPMKTRLGVLDEFLKKCRGKKYLGLCQKTIPEIDEKLLGLRKFNLLAAAPNVGKTALTIQFSVDILRNHQDACLVFFSLEMQEADIFIRMICNRAQMDWKSFVLGTGNNDRNVDPSAHHSKEELADINKARTELEAMGDRLQIVDSSRIADLDAKKAITFINEIKSKTGATRVIVVIDYLQVWPLTKESKSLSELEADKWRVGEIKKIRDAINDDPIIVISEARKPQGDGKWGAELSDVMGSARGTYSPDAVFLSHQLDFEDFSKMWSTDGKVGRYQKKGSTPDNKKQNDEEIQKLCEHLEHEGISLCRLDMPKGRDGMQKFSILLEFHYRKNIFRPTNFAKLKADAMKRK